jgi:deaminated glutathione amidase
MKYLAAAVQMTSTDSRRRNAARAEKLVREAADRGAELIGLPENWLCMSDGGVPKPEPMHFESGPVARLRDLCRDLKITLVAGTVPVKAAGGKFFNTCPVVGPNGEISAIYRKIHLFDVDISDGAHHKESKYFASGGEAVVVETQFGPIGLTICYDLRFPELFRRLALSGTRVIFTPAAFTLHTGKDHWLPLLRARAIENLVYVVAPAQFGRNTERRQTYGKSLIADPWGTVIALAPDREGVAVAEINYEYQDSIRAQLPALTHVKGWLFGEKNK